MICVGFQVFFVIRRINPSKGVLTKRRKKANFFKFVFRNP